MHIKQTHNKFQYQTTTSSSLTFFGCSLLVRGWTIIGLASSGVPSSLCFSIFSFGILSRCLFIIAAPTIPIRNSVSISCVEGERDNLSANATASGILVCPKLQLILPPDIQKPSLAIIIAGAVTSLVKLCHILDIIATITLFCRHF